MDNTAIDMILLYAAKYGESDRMRDQAKELLFERHKGMIYKEAHKMSSSGHSNRLHKDDYISVGQIAAMDAYERYKPWFKSKRGYSVKLSTYVFATANSMMKSLGDEPNLVRCTAQKRGMRTYLNGGYDHDPEKKKKFEEKNRLTSEDAIAKARRKHAALLTSTESLDSLVDEESKTSFYEVIPDPKNLNPDRILNNMVIQEFVDSWTDLQKEIFFKRYDDKMSPGDIADDLGMQIKDINRELRNIKKKTEKYRETIFSEEERLLEM